MPENYVWMASQTFLCEVGERAKLGISSVNEVGRDKVVLYRACLLMHTRSVRGTPGGSVGDVRVGQSLHSLT